MTSSQTWLDEQLFGWSRASPRTSRAWKSDLSSSAVSSARPSEPGSPTAELSEDEVGDYDNLLGYLDGQSHGGKGRQSKVSSYADLQKLKQNGGGGDGLVLNPNLDDEGTEVKAKQR